jgi:predicted ATP-dependent endonuclease of OLD family
LKAVYTLGEDDDPAIRNLLVLAGTSYDEALEVATAADRGRKTVWLDRTRERLLENFTRAWRQSDLEVRFHLDGTVLTVLMSMQAEDFIEIDQRSDGLRQFVALRSYITVAHGSVKPIILIDEAETHLHYDAQADLVQVLEDQEDAAKIIYTTHSAGCLPRDLGTGIRAVVPVTGDRDGEVVQTDDSEIINKFWTQGRGFSPVLIAMGASAFAFSSARRAVIAEGMCETLLLPSLVREAIGGSLDYQVAPGFADATGAEVNDLDLVAARVAYVADGDAGGRDHARKLRRQGVLAEQILYLGGEQSGLSLEDLLVKEVYVDAVNDELSRRHGIRIPATAVPEAGRSAAVARWCRRQTRPDGQAVELSKVDVAQRVLDQRLRRQLLAPQRRILLRQLDEQIRAVLDQATASLGRGEVEQV